VQGIAGAADVNWEEPWLGTDLDSGYAVKEVPDLNPDIVGDISSVSNLDRPSSPVLLREVNRLPMTEII
jgi:hypothetical protein